MPDVTPAGPLSVAIDSLRTLIANVPAFQTLVGVANATDALPSIYVGEVGYPLVSASVASNVLTFTIRDDSTIQVGDTVTLSGASIGGQSSASLNREWTITGVSDSTYTATPAAGNVDDLAIVYPDDAFVLTGTRPLAVICEGDNPMRSDVIGLATPVYAGVVEILLEADVSSDYQNDARNALYEARNTFGGFIQGIGETQGTGDLMVLNKIEPVNGPEFTSKIEQDDNTKRFERWRALVRVEWGLEG